MPGYEAPSNVAWSTRNRSPLVRIPDRRGLGTRCELRMPDPSCNPYLALTVQLAAGLDGVERKLEAREPVHRNIFTMSFRDRRKYRIDELPRDLHEALELFEKDDVVKAALGEHLTERFLEAKRNEVLQYNLQVSQWEIDTLSGEVLSGRRAGGQATATLRPPASRLVSSSVTRPNGSGSSSSTGSRRASSVRATFIGDRRDVISSVEAPAPCAPSGQLPRRLAAEDPAPGPGCSRS